jgi:hypothetical protein
MNNPEQLVQAAEPEHALGERRGRLMRTLTGFANLAMTYSGVGGSAGIFALFGLSLAAAGPAFFWGWPFVVLGTLFVCLIWAELSSHYPFAAMKAVKLVMPVRTAFYGMREFSVQDPGGHFLTFAQPVAPPKH